jgi:malonate transporter
VAVDLLNRIALHVAFPSLVVVTLGAPSSSPAHGLAFYALVPVALLVSLGLVRLLVPARARGSVALVVAFGNTAYLGLPFVAAVLGPGSLPTASLAVAVHVALAMTVGPALLLRWSGREVGPALLHKLARQPLVWSPVVGLVVRAAPELVREPTRAVLAPLGAMAGPLSMLLLGLYLALHQRDLRVSASVVAHVLSRLVLAPAVTLGLVLAARARGLLASDEARVLTLLAAMPAAITTFSIAHEHQQGTDDVAAAIVGSTLAAALTLPIVTWIALTL